MPDPEVRKPRHGAQARQPTSLDRHLGGRLRVLRISQGLSRAEMAVLLRVSPEEVRAYERGMRRISPARLVEYAELLEVRLSRFFADAGPWPLPSLVGDP
jgi:transcriptional regulator with XRE-family HTH domain